MILTFAECRLDCDALTLTRDGAPVPVEPQVFDLVRLLAESPGRVVTRDEIIARVWGGRIVSDSAISARIAAARKAVGDDGKRQAVIRTVARRGLQMAVPVDRDAPEAPAPVTPPRVRYARNAAGQMIAYTVTGDGPPVLNVSFFARAVEREWQVPSRRLLLEALAARHRLVCYDEIGAGLSTRGMEGVSIDSKAGEIRAVADAAGLERFAIMAESGGAQQAIAFAAAWPERVTALVLSGGYADGRLRRGTADSDFVRAMIHEGWSPGSVAISRAYLTAYCPDGPFEAAAEVAQMMQEATHRADMLYQRDLSNGASVAHLLDRITCPTLVIHARGDMVHPLAEGQKLAAGIRRAELHVLESGNHLPLAGSEGIRPYLDQITGFLAAHAGDAAPTGAWPQDW
ncbi:alpha/beta fold hydrolase [Pseudoponticoccus marisrubri]|uniref:OmpR/PhoB-type domain-containing protein n=1 Tax=Pseudoponticoccus marisrubri TaxID=1685382 RepID=A0A0W7WES3_9RHOB|nr:alpha/beta fold hydrolase [Pseudoponticoccus marisrubri]KUF09136.1 hypothetical protein AVJ23_18835 [Pseudoponticoccus marisrubri]